MVRSTANESRQLQTNPGARGGVKNGAMAAKPEVRPLVKRLTQEQRRERSESRMLAAAIELIARQGSGRTTLVEIGRAAGYTHGLVGHRFGSKGGLVSRLLKNLQRDFAGKQLADITQHRKGLDALLEVVKSSLILMAAGSRSARVIRALTVMAAEALGPTPENLGDVVSLNRNFKAVLRRLIEEGVAAGEIRKDVRPAEQATAILGTIRGIEIQWCQDPQSISMESLIAEVIESLRRSLERRPPAN